MGRRPDHQAAAVEQKVGWLCARQAVQKSGLHARPVAHLEDREECEAQVIKGRAAVGATVGATCEQGGAAAAASGSAGWELRQWHGEYLNVLSRLPEQALGSPERRGRPPRRLARSSSSWPMLTANAASCAETDKLKGIGGPLPPPRSNGSQIAAPTNTPPALPQPSLHSD